MFQITSNLRQQKLQQNLPISKNVFIWKVIKSSLLKFLYWKFISDIPLSFPNIILKDYDFNWNRKLPHWMTITPAWPITIIRRLLSNIWTWHEIRTFHDNQCTLQGSFIRKFCYKDKGPFNPFNVVSGCLFQ